MEPVALHLQGLHVPAAQCPEDSFLYFEACCVLKGTHLNVELAARDNVRDGDRDTFLGAVTGGMTIGVLIRGGGLLSLDSWHIPLPYLHASTIGLNLQLTIDYSHDE